MGHGLRGSVGLAPIVGDLLLEFEEHGMRRRLIEHARGARHDDRRTERKDRQDDQNLDQ